MTTPRLINGYTVYAYSTPPNEDGPACAYMESRKAGSEDEPLTFRIFKTRRFRNGIEAMSAARNALAAVKTVDDEGVPDPMPE
ncbi:hypothetical protein CAL29_17705 [Bordetella genomosp. 10]|uniref:Uncharacterized protein n=1 Tax=Bordetella genomosp. 10 TaxID=1416804 RepID=A0A261RXX4_9BORD|nr:hypothetical protein [Bordetella genomosp. 10]OZI29928.1 hypothetical protein CAL29_17705 [Bordetella genomosp. 10]